MKHSRCVNSKILQFIPILVLFCSLFIVTLDAKHHKKYELPSAACNDKYHELDAAELTYVPGNKKGACRMKFKTDNFDQSFLVNFKDYDIKDCGTRLRIFNEEEPQNAIDLTCNSVKPTPTLFKTTRLVAELTGISQGPGRGFNIMLTAVAKRAICGGFKCKSDKFCIDGDLKCDRVAHCVDASDEENCSFHGTKKALKIGAGIIAAIVIGILVCCALTIGGCIWFMRRRQA